MERPIQYTVSNHRNLQNQVQVGYVLRGEPSLKREHVKGPWSSLEDVLAAAYIQDPSLCRELNNMMGMSPDISMYDCREDFVDGQKDLFPSYLTNPDEQLLLTQIRQLEDILFSVRGDQRNSAGSFKMPSEYHEEVPVKKIVKRRKKDKATEYLGTAFDKAVDKVGAVNVAKSLSRYADDKQMELDFS